MKEPIYADDSTERIGLLLKLRLPWLLLGLLGGVVGTQISARYEHLLASHVSLVFFVPVIVYMSDAVGTQTETIYVRNLAKKQLRFSLYLFKEFIIGILLGIIFGFLIGAFTYVWLQQLDLAWTVGLAMFASVGSAPLVALIVASTINKEHGDPAVGAGPFTTVIQDLISLIIYFTIASLIIF